ncbi:MAG: hypothetical protein RLZZ450_4649 [Pseudomonadota bacterium]|jgi:uncharacterized repeat protein (TIGR02543 family)
MSRFAWLALTGALCAVVSCGNDSPSKKTKNTRCTADDDCGDGQQCVDSFCDEAASSTATARISAQAQGAAATLDVEGGADCSATQEESACTVRVGETVTLTAPEVDGHRFVSWSGDARCVGKDPQLALPATKDTHCFATYVRRVRVSGVVDGAEGVVSAKSSSAGAVCDDDGCLVDVGAEVVLTAPQRDGFRLAGWSGDGCQHAAETRVTVTAGETDVSCTASFVASLTVRGSAQRATVQIVASSDGPHAQCDTDHCAIDAGDAVTLTAPAADGRRFSGWSGGEECAGEEPALALVDVQASLGCTANYLTRYTVSAKSEGSMPAASIEAASPDALATCDAQKCEVDDGGSATLTATTVPGYRLTGFKGEGCDQVSGAVVTVSDVHKNIECTARYETGIAVIGSIEGATGMVLATSKSPTASCAAGSCTVGPGDEVVLTAPELRDHRFLGWKGDDVCKAVTKAITISKVMTSTSCVAKYASRYRISGTADELRGSVTASSDALAASCANASCTVDEGASVLLTAVPKSARYRFTGWSGGGGCTGSNAALVLREVRGNIVCTANFAQRTLIQADVNPAETGVASPDGTLVTGAECEPGQCAVDKGALVPVTATAAPGYRFVRWSGCSTASTPTIAVQVDNDTVCTANFEPIKYVVTARAGGGGGVAARVTGGNDCVNASCTISVGQTVDISATANENDGYAFTGWTGCAAVPADSAQATLRNVTADVTCTANFKVLQHQVTWAVEPASGGRVEPDFGNTLNCLGGPCTIRHGSGITLTATANSGYVFSGWSGAGTCTGTNTALVLTSVREDTRCVANFESNNLKFSAMVGNADPMDSATNVVSANNAACPNGVCSLTITRGGNVTVRVQANATAQGMLNWSGCTPSSQTMMVSGESIVYLSMFNSLTAPMVCTGVVVRN